MGHLTVKSYKSLYRRMDQFVNAPFNSKEFYEILKILFTDKEALLCSVMPLLPASLEKISKVWEISENETQLILDELVNKGLVYEDDYNGVFLYTLAIPVFGYFEFSLMRNDGKFDRKLLSKLYSKYINDDDGFVKKYFSSEPTISRTYIQEEILPDDITSEILPYEKSSHIIETADTISVGTCFCRHKMEHLGKGCGNPQDVCLSFGNIAKSLVERGIAREVTKTEAADIVKLCIDNGLVQIGDNIQNKPAVICNCCGCCCDLLLSYKKTGISTIVSPSSYIANIDITTCNDCGLCIDKCPVDAVSLTDDKIAIDEDWCLGCGVCANFCETEACKMLARPEKVDVPEDTLQKVVLAAIHQAKVGNFIFDDQKNLTHKFLRSTINLIIKIPAVKSYLLKRTVRERILRIAFKKSDISDFNI